MTLVEVPIPAFHSQHGEVLIIGFTEPQGSPPKPPALLPRTTTPVAALVVSTTGGLFMSALGDLSVHWRYSEEMRRWYVGSEDWYAEEEADDGGSEVPGQLPFDYRTRDGYSLDEEGGGAGDVDTGEAP